MIDIKKLTKKDRGRYVKYTDFRGDDIGRIKSWNDKYIFVVYQRPGKDLNFYEHYTAIATNPEDLTFLS